MITLANAPVSYGVFGLSRPDLVPLPSGGELLRLVHEADYQGIDLGAHGLFGTGRELVDNLAANDLLLCGGWLDFPFAGTDQEFSDAVDAALPILDDFALVAESQSGPSPLPTLADSGSAERRARPGGAPELELHGQRWRTFVDRVERVGREVRSRSLEPTFHHHVSTHIETPAEIERFLSDTSIDLTFDSGHLLLGGGEPVEDYRRWAPRINHLHLKDVNLRILAAAKGSDDPVRDVWEKKAFVALGTGDLDLTRMVDDIIASGFDGWLVVEQDVVLLDEADVLRAIADQIANRHLLRRWFP
ncbi:MAG: sugar phosphate isomerase/epimerase [Arachnia sp.]